MPKQIFIAIDGTLSENECNAVRQQWPKVHEQLKDKSEAAIQEAAMKLILDVHAQK